MARQLRDRIWRVNSGTGWRVNSGTGWRVNSGTGSGVSGLRLAGWGGMSAGEREGRGLGIPDRRDGLKDGGKAMTPSETLGGRAAETEENKALLARLAWMYYHQDLTQQAIADQLGLSRNKVLRLLARAREEGIVQIRVVHPSIRYMELEDRLTETFGLQEAVVVPTGDSDERTLEAVGQFGAMYLERTLRAGDVVGTAWGVALREVARHLRPLDLGDVTVVQLMGGLPADGLVNPLDVARVIAEKLGGQAHILYTPAFVDTPAILEALMSDQRVAQTLRAGAAVTKALVGIGDVSRQSSLVRWRALTVKEMDEVVADGAVGDILGRFFDAEGRPVESPLSARIVAASLDTVRDIPRVIAFAAGERKAAAILGALRGGYVDVLVTDEVAARAALALHAQPVRQRQEERCVSSRRSPRSE